MWQLSEGSLLTVMSGGVVENIIIQVIGSKKITSGAGNKERLRLLLSDGKYFISHAMLTTQYNDKLYMGEIPPMSIIKINRYITSVIGDKGKDHAQAQKRVMVIVEMELLASGDDVKVKIGAPELLPDDVSQYVAKANANGSSNGSSSTTSTAANKSIGKPKPTVPAQDLNQSVLSSQLTHPISSLSPYQNKWVIKARVTNKSGIRKWSNSRGEGQLFSMDLLDESGEIRVTFFRDHVDKFYDMIEIDKVYYISKCQLKPANKQYSTLKNDYEMTISNDSVIQPCLDDVSAIPATSFNFVTIDKLANVEPGTMLDIIGVCKSAGEVQTFTAKSTGRELKKRELTILDQSNTSISLTLWGTDAEKFDASNKPVIAIRGAKVSEFNGGKNVSLLGSSIMKIDPDINESHKLRGWYDNCGSNLETVNISAGTGGGGFSTPWLSFQEVLNKNLGHGEKGDYFQTKATILLVRSENAIYKACPTEGCNKKVVDLENGMYRCEKCNREYPNFKYRLLVSMNLGDWSRNQWVSMFSSEAEKVFGKTSQEIGEAKETDGEAFANMCDAVHFKEYIFKFRAKTETYSDETRLKTIAVNVDPINYKEYNAQLISRINVLLTE